jgi:hypothetical protein
MVLALLLCYCVFHLCLVKKCAAQALVSVSTVLETFHAPLYITMVCPAVAVFRNVTSMVGEGYGMEIHNFWASVDLITFAVGCPTPRM